MNNKNLRLKLRKLYNNYLPKYDIAVKPVSSGYQYGTGINTNTFNSTAGEDISPQTTAINKAAIVNTAAKAGSYISSTATNLATNWTSKAAASAAQQGGNTAVKAGLSTAGKAAAAVGAVYGAYDLASTLYQNANDYRTASDMAKASGTATQSAEGVDYTVYTGINEKAERDYVDALNKSYTLSGVTGGAGLGMSVGTLAGGPIGAAIGLVGGGIIGGVASAITNEKREKEAKRAMEHLRWMQGGYNLQALSEAASQGMRNKFNLTHGEGSGLVNADHGMDAYMPSARTTESEAKKNKFGIVWGPGGKQFGPINSLVGKGESLIDYNAGKASYVSEGIFREDNIGSIAANGDGITIAGNDKDWLTGNTFAKLVAPYTKAVEFANSILENPIKGQSKATQLKQQEEAIKLKQYAFAQMKPITDRQQWQHGFKFNKGKISKFDTEKITLPDGTIEEYPVYGKEDYLSSLLGFEGDAPLSKYDIPLKHFKLKELPETSANDLQPYQKEMLSKIKLAEANADLTRSPGKPSVTGSLFKSFYNNIIPYGLLLSPAIEQWSYYKGNRPYAANSFIANPVSRQALNALGSMRYDPYSKIQAVKDANRLAIYGINSMGGLSRGQRMAMLTAQNNNYMKNLAEIRGEGDLINNHYKQTFAKALAEEGRDYATRSQQALAKQQEDYAKAVAARRRGIETAYANAANVFQKMIQDRSNLAIADKTLGMYQLDLDNRAKQIAAIYAANCGKDAYGRLKRRKK